MLSPRCDDDYDEPCPPCPPPRDKGLAQAFVLALVASFGTALAEHAVPALVRYGRKLARQLREPAPPPAAPRRKPKPRK